MKGRPVINQIPIKRRSWSRIFSWGVFRLCWSGNQISQS